MSGIRRQWADRVRHCQDQMAVRRRIDRGQHIPDAPHALRCSAKADRNVRAKRQGRFGKPWCRKGGRRPAVQMPQNGCGVARPAAEARPDGYLLVDADRKAACLAADLPVNGEGAKADIVLGGTERAGKRPGQGHTVRFRRPEPDPVTEISEDDDGIGGDSRPRDGRYLD